MSFRTLSLRVGSAAGAASRSMFDFDLVSCIINGSGVDFLVR